MSRYFWKLHRTEVKLAFIVTLSATALVLTLLVLFDVFGHSQDIARDEANRVTGNLVCATLDDAKRRTEVLQERVTQGLVANQGLLDVSLLREQDLASLADDLGIDCNRAQ